MSCGYCIFTCIWIFHFSFNLANQQSFVGINVVRLFGDKTNMLVKYMNMMHDAIA